MEKYKDRTWAEINLNNLMHNVQTIKSKVDEKTKTMWVVKADAYGHGDKFIADELIKLGVNKDNLIIEGKGGVSTLDPASYNRRVIIEAM